MRINWPLVSRTRYDNLRWQFDQARLTAHVAETTIQHLMDGRLDHVTEKARAKIEIAALKKKITRLERDRVVDGCPV
jgi:hypothetical protein